MTAMQRLSDDDPMMIAWRDYCATDEAKNSEYWAKHVTVDNPRDGRATVQHLHLKGSLWSAFVAGYNSATKHDKKEEG